MKGRRTNPALAERDTTDFFDLPLLEIAGMSVPFLSAVGLLSAEAHLVILWVSLKCGTKISKSDTKLATDGANMVVI